MNGAAVRSLAEAEHHLQRAFFSHYPDAAIKPLEQMETAAQVEIFTRQPVPVMLPLWERLFPEIGQRILAGLPAAVATETMRALDPGRLAPMLAGAEDEDRERLLALIGDRAAKEVREALHYPTECAGALMDTREPRFREHGTVAEVLAHLRDERRTDRTGCFVVDSDNRLVGWVDMKRIALASPDERVGDLVRDVAATVDSMATLEEVGERLETHRLPDLAVLDPNRRLIGVIRHASLVEAEMQRASVGIQTMVGVSKDEHATSTAFFAVRKRLPWLQLNLVTAFAAASVVGIFEHTVARFTALAVLLPVVAGQSGNTGAQALAVTMRGLALHEIRVAQWPGVIFKETKVGLWNGVVVAATTAAGVLLWTRSHGLALIIAISMVLSMILAGVAGAAIPILLTVLGQDPAQSSSIVLTTITDIARVLQLSRDCNAAGGE